ncbi:hypothetical protein EO241_29570, partial [Escherichia coli]
MLRGVRQQQDEPGRFSICSRQAAVVHPCYTVFHEQTETFSSLWSEYHDDFRQFLHIYSQDVACYGE